MSDEDMPVDTPVEPVKKVSKDDGPKRIAAYLLKGWVLTNEYCPNNTNVPLVRSRAGTYVCCGCDAGSSCPFAEKDARAAQQAKVEAPAPAPAAPPQVPVAAPLAAAGAEVRAVAVPPAASAAPLESGGDVEVTLQGAELRFGCSVAATRTVERHRVTQLLGGVYHLRLRLALPVGARGSTPDTEPLKEAAASLCKEFTARILVPQRLASRPVSDEEDNDGELLVAGDGGKRFKLPEGDCVLLPLARGSTEELVQVVHARLAESPAAAALRAAGAGWLEVTLVEALTGTEVAVKRRWALDAAA